jgi:aerobic carbon-monoxide dehydrogenase small subunit
VRFLHAGFIMLAADAPRSNPYLDDDEFVEMLSSNPCRCTGYRDILTAVEEAAAEMRS